MSTCIFCSTADNLNTRMTIALEDGAKAEVTICDEHAEDATVKTARVAWLARQQQVADFMEQAKRLGIYVPPAGTTQSPAGLVVATAQPRPAPPARQAEVFDQFSPDDVVVPTSVLDRGVSSVGGSVNSAVLGAVSVTSHQSYAVKATDSEGRTLDSAAREGRAKIAMVEGRGGHPLAIPVVRQDGTGTTRMKIVKHMDPRRMDDRFKQMAGDSIADLGPDFRNEYEMHADRPCTFCGGGGRTQHQGRLIECPKCLGVGTIQG